MITWFTGNPGHGKTLHAIDLLLDYIAQGRICYVCNVTEFDYSSTGALKMLPEEFRRWPEVLPDGAVCLVDECYQHDMLTKAPPGSKVPPHIEQLATHRHRGLDFIFISQSPRTQVHTFIHDLVERHIHVRRLFGTKFVNLREFDYLEAKPLRGTPINSKRVRLPTRPMGKYKSTVLDTTERRIPWYLYLFVILLLVAPFTAWYAFHRVTTINHADDEALTPAGADGAPATAKPAGVSATKSLGPREYLDKLNPRIEGQPWTAEFYDGLQRSNAVPMLYCMSSGLDGRDSCSCVTEQGTIYRISFDLCRAYARTGLYNPHRQLYANDGAPTTAHNARDRLSERYPSGSRTSGHVQVFDYGGMRPGLPAVAPYSVDGAGEFPTRDVF